MIHNLPVEITRDIFYHISIQHTPNKGCKMNNKDICTCWQLDLLSVSMVCTSWYSIAVEIMLSKGEMPFKSLLNYASQQRSYPFRSRLVNLFQESKLSNLIFHHSIRHLVMDFASFDTIRREKQKNNTILKRKIHHAQALSDMTELLQLCKNTVRLDIICDAGFTSLLSQHNSISSTVNTLANQLYKNNKIKRLDLIGFNPIQRCPCCAGKDWDHYLIPLMNCLELDTLVLQHVLPSEQVLNHLAEQSTIKNIVLYQSLITLSESQVVKDIHGNFIKKQKRRNSEQRINSLSRIPSKLWHQITSISIFEDIEDASLWPNRRYLYDLVDFVGPQLQEFTLQFGTKEKNELSLVNLKEIQTHDLHISDPLSILHKLKVKCKDSLYSVRLINVPENQPIR